MSEGRDTLSKRYRDLAREEPPAALDAAILAASREQVSKASFSRRWGAPVSIAAVLVLAFGLSLEMQREKPDVSTSLPVTKAPAAARRADGPATPLAARREPAPSALALPTRPEQPALEQKQRYAAPLAKESTAGRIQSSPEVAAPATMAAPAAPAPMRAPSADSNAAPATAGAAPASRMKSAAEAVQLKARAAAPQEAELEGIAKLRADGRDADADRELEAFVRKYPDYRIADAMWERVKPR